MSRTALAPIISVIALALGSIFQLTQAEISAIEEGLGIIGSAIFAGLGIYGIFKNHKKKDKGGK